MKKIHDTMTALSMQWLRENVDKNASEFITKGKYKYLYPIDKKMKKRVELLRVPYPKRDDKK